MAYLEYFIILLVVFFVIMVILGTFGGSNKNQQYGPNVDKTEGNGN